MLPINQLPGPLNIFLEWFHHKLAKWNAEKQNPNSINYIHLRKLTWQWKITFFNRKSIFTGWIFHCHLRFFFRRGKLHNGTHRTISKIKENKTSAIRLFLLNLKSIQGGTWHLLKTTAFPLVHLNMGGLNMEEMKHLEFNWNSSFSRWAIPLLLVYELFWFNISQECKYTKNDFTLSVFHSFWVDHL